MGFLENLDLGALSELDRLKVAFSCHYAKKIADADGVLDMEEIGLLMGRFSDPLMDACGFTDARGAFTPKFHAAVEDARKVLRDRIPEASKLELIEVCFDAVQADGDAGRSEESLMFQAAEDLGLSLEVVGAHLARRS